MLLFDIVGSENYLEKRKVSEIFVIDLLIDCSYTVKIYRYVSDNTILQLYIVHL